MVAASDDRLMGEALQEARRCLEWGDVPIGAIVAREGEVTAHAEILALRSAGEKVGSWRLEGCSIYVTLEPCAMCAGAMVLARVDRLVFGATDPKAGFAGSLGNLVSDPRLNHRLEVEGGVLEEESADLLRRFFADRRRPS